MLAPQATRRAAHSAPMRGRTRSCPSVLLLPPPRVPRAPQPRASCASTARAGGSGATSSSAVRAERGGSRCPASVPIRTRAAPARPPGPRRARSTRATSSAPAQLRTASTPRVPVNASPAAVAEEHHDRCFSRAAGSARPQRLSVRLLDPTSARHAPLMLDASTVCRADAVRTCSASTACGRGMPCPRVRDRSRDNRPLWQDAPIVTKRYGSR